MRICMCSPTFPQLNCANNASDGATPEEKTKQILALAPILRGQQHNQQSNVSQPQQGQHASQQSSRPQQHAPGHDDLIDFGQSHPAPVPSGPVGQTDHLQLQPDAPTGMQAPLQPGHPIKRVDTGTKDLDEFVDAPGY